MRETVEDQRELESLKRRLDERLKTRSKSSPIYSIIQQPKITRQAEERRVAQEQVRRHTVSLLISMKVSADPYLLTAEFKRTQGPSRRASEAAPTRGRGYSTTVA